MDRKELNIWVEKYRRGDISRRNCLKVTAIGATMAALGLRGAPAFAGDLSGTVMPDFKSIVGARIILSGIETIHMMRKRKARCACNSDPSITEQFAILGA